VSARPSILIVDDHQSIRDPLSTYLQRFDFEVETAADGRQMREWLARRGFSMIVLDVMLPGEDGLSLCRYVASQVRTPVILLSAVSEQADRIAGLEVGADDYLVKPFDPRELVARIRSVLRRSQSTLHPPPAAPAASTQIAAEQRFTFDGWTFDTQKRELHDPGGVPVPMSTVEFHLLRVFLEHPGRVLSRNLLLDLTERADNVMYDRSIDSQVSRLRKKLESDPRHPQLLKTIRGDGYMLTARVTAQRA